MSDTRIKLTGGQAALVNAVLIVIAGVQFVRLQTTLDEKAKDTIRFQIYLDYAGESSELIEQAKKEEQSPESVEKLLKHVQNLDTITIISLKARKSGNDIVVRAEFTIDGKPQKTRYFLMKPSLIGQWTVKRETSALSYYATFW